jgi:hypothetical protein
VIFEDKNQDGVTLLKFSGAKKEEILKKKNDVEHV